MGPPPSGADPIDLVFGGVLQTAEAASLGMPFEVVKTKQIQDCKAAGKMVSTLEVFNAIKSNGWSAFYKGLDAKVWESMLKGAVFMFTNQLFLSWCEMYLGYARKSTGAGLIAGAGAGIAQTVIMAPATYIVSAKNAHKGMSTMQVVKNAGFFGLYAGGGAVAGRQATNWGLRQGLVAKVTGEYKNWRGGGDLSKPELMGCGIVGGGLSALNQPFEVLRVWQQTAKSQGKPVTMGEAARSIHQQFGIRGFYLGVVPRVGLCAYQSLFMITIADICRSEYKKMRGK